MALERLERAKQLAEEVAQREGPTLKVARRGAPERCVCCHGDLLEGEELCACLGSHVECAVGGRCVACGGRFQRGWLTSGRDTREDVRMLRGALERTLAERDRLEQELRSEQNNRHVALALLFCAALALVLGVVLLSAGPRRHDGEGYGARQGAGR